MYVNPYLCFEGQAEDAINFYRDAIGAEVTMLMRFADMPDSSECEAKHADKIMHAVLKIGSTVVMVSDGQLSGKASFEGVSMSMGVETLEQAQRLFDRLAEGGHVTMPIESTFWTPSFGMLTDRFGVSWMVNVDSPDE